MHFMEEKWMRIADVAGNLEQKELEAMSPAGSLQEQAKGKHSDIQAKEQQMELSECELESVVLDTRFYSLLKQDWQMKIVYIQVVLM